MSSTGKLALIQDGEHLLANISGGADDGDILAHGTAFHFSWD